jgi:hypothetical protein
MDYAIGAGVGVAVAALLIWVYVRTMMKNHIVSLVKKQMAHDHLSLARRALTKQAKNLVWFSYAELDNKRVRLTVEDRGSPYHPDQGEDPWEQF